ncbi:MAG: dimethylmenaquinone methyltransferase [Gammaproteobacteria bacterium RIFCSPLOWO2_02_FULL_56_15]|nr:MAG: dimethylmenaquinone methyltransferase [Gammaproteobacteria bacterium RIFCSPLOWO2_02_FULL_56_15]
MGVPDTLVERLRRLDSCAVSDALDSLGQPGCVSGIIQLTGTRRIAGRAVTVKIGTSKPAGGTTRHLSTGAIEAAHRGDVIVIEQRTGIEAAGWGGVLSNAAKYREVSGVVVDGPARDINESRALDFPVFARSATALTARGRTYEEDFNCPVCIGALTVHPGDLVIADASAVVFIPAANAEQVITIAERITAREALMTRDIHQGKPASRVMGTDYETMLDAPTGSDPHLGSDPVR